MKWDRVSDWCVRSGDYLIAKYQVAERKCYRAFCKDSSIGGVFTDAQAAKNACAEHARAGK